MDDQSPEQDAASLSEPMSARIEIEGLDSAPRQKELTDTISALAGISGMQIEKGAVHVTYDPLQTSAKKIEEAILGTGSHVTKAETETEKPHPETA
ncbi:MAG: hypothetical protein ABI839_05025 [Verrucomicrobiota bacterium]